MRTLPTTLTLILLSLPAQAMPVDDPNSCCKQHGTCAEIIQPIQISKTADLWFGEIIVDKAKFPGGIITQGCDQTRTFTAEGVGAWTTVKQGLKYHNANFKVTGQEGFPFTFVVPLDAIPLTMNGAAEPALLTAVFKHLPIAGVGGVTHGILQAEVEVGGILALPPNMKPGAYSGSFNVMVCYQ